MQKGDGKSLSCVPVPVLVPHVLLSSSPTHLGMTLVAVPFGQTPSWLAIPQAHPPPLLNPTFLGPPSNLIGPLPLKVLKILTLICHLQHSY